MIDMMRKGLHLRCYILCGSLLFLLVSTIIVQAGIYESFNYEVHGDHIEIVGCDPSQVTAPIPSEIVGLPVTHIGAYAFTNCTSLTGVVFPETISSINEGAYEGCTALLRAVYLGNVPNLETNAFTGVHSNFIHYTRGQAMGDGHPVINYEAYVEDVLSIV